MKQIILKLGCLEAAQCFSTRCNRSLQVMNFDITKDRGFDSAIGEVKVRFCSRATLLFPVPMFDLRQRKPHCRGITVWGQLVDDRTTRIPQSQQLRHFVESFTGSVVAGVADALIRPTFSALLSHIEMGVSAGDYQCQHWKTDLTIAFLTLLEQDGMDVTFKVIHRDQGLIEREGEC